MKCLECFEEVVDGEVSCPYCGADLDSVLEMEEEEEGRLSPLITVSDEAEAYSIRDLLESHGISATIESYSGSGDVFGYDDDVWGEIFVSTGQLDIACSVVHKYMESALKVDNVDDEIASVGLEDDGDDDDEDEEEEYKYEEEGAEIALEP